MRKFSFKECALIFPLLLSSVASAADITGQISDPAGASLPHARITVSSARGEKLRTTVTDESGRFAFTGLAPGKYILQAESDLFETAPVDVAVTDSTPSAPVAISLKLKQVKQQIDVSARLDSLTLPGAAAAQEKLETIPGNVSKIPSDAYQGGAVTSMDDALSLTPGVFAQPKEGSEEVRLSIRGSGLNVPFGLRGVRLLRNGIPLTQADGFINPELADASNADYIEVYRGADALEFGAATLGGAINFVSPNGRSRPGSDARMEFGSFGYRRGQIRYGAATEDGRLDAFIALSGFFADGFRENSKESGYRFSGNTGYRFTPKSEGRLFLDYERVDLRRPDGITLSQLQRDPFVAGTGAVRSNARIDLNPTIQVAYQHTLLLGDDDRLSLGAQYIKSNFDNPYPFAHSRGKNHDYGLSLRHEANRGLWTHKNRFAWGGNWVRGGDDGTTSGPVYFGNFLAEPNSGILQSIRDRRGLMEFFAQDSYSLTSTITVVAGGQIAYAQRDLVAGIPAPPTFFPIFSLNGHPGITSRSTPKRVCSGLRGGKRRYLRM
ncbi:MAG: carboxypeptidase regulatory-like domain-containing protein [Bryobacteraceae bacterium]